MIFGKVSIESVIYSDGWRGYNGLVDVGYSKYFRVSHGDNEFAREGHCHIKEALNKLTMPMNRQAHHKYNQQVTIHLDLVEGLNQSFLNGIESFWSFTKRRLAKFNGVSVNFELHLKESEWRWEKQPDELASELWQLIRCISPDLI